MKWSGLTMATTVIGICSIWAVPPWWEERGVINASPEKDEAPALQGQVKHVVVKAFEEFESSLAPVGGAGESLQSMISSQWFTDTSKDSAPCQLGQLKTMSAPFYDRLRELNIDAGNKVTGGALYPWSEEVEDDADEAPAAIGQLKHVFSFEFDEDGDRLPDWWEARVFSTYAHDGNGDADEDGLSNLTEFKNGSKANVADSDGDGTIDSKDARPLAYDQPKPVIRGEGLEVYGGAQPAERMLAKENQLRKRLGLREFASVAEQRAARKERAKQLREAKQEGERQEQ